MNTNDTHKMKAGVPLVAMEKASFSLGDKTVFPNVTWKWKAGEQWALLGPNGSGKSLFLQAMQGRLPRAGGDLSHGFDLETGSGLEGRLNRQSGIVEVSPRIQGDLAREVNDYYQARWHAEDGEAEKTVKDYLSQASVENILPCEVDASCSDPVRFAKAARRYIRWLDVTSLLPRKMAYLSNGEQRKVLLIHELLKFPQLLVLDDPYGGLDANTRSNLRETISKLMEKGERVMVAVSRPEEIPPGATHVLLMQRMRVVGQGLKDDVLNLERTWRMFKRGNPASPRKTKPCKNSNSPVSQVTRHLSDSTPILEMRNVRIVDSGKVILHEINWTVKAGERWALTGHNGAGKTTLLSLIQGDHPQVYAQDIRFFGAEVASTQAVWRTRMRIGWMSPELSLHYPAGWPCFEVVCSGFFNSIGLYHGCTTGQRSMARHWLKTMGLSDLEGTAFGELSTGMQRMVLLCRAVVKKPRLLLLDEPCQGVDARHAEMILSAVDRLVVQTGAALIFVTHHRGELPACITHSMMMKKGKIYLQA